MKKIMLLLFAFFLAGCGAEEISGSFMLFAAPGYVRSESDIGTPHTYIVDTSENEVYVETFEEGFTDEERAAIDNMTSEEFVEFMESQPIYEEPLYEISFLEATVEEIILEYEGERVEFTALSDSYFEREDGNRFVIEYDSSIDEYRNNLMQQ